MRTFFNELPDDFGPVFDVLVELEVRNNSSTDRTYKCTFYNIGNSGNVPIIEVTEKMRILAGQNQGIRHIFEEVDTATALNGYLTVNCGLLPLSAILHLSINFSLDDLSQDMANWHHYTLTYAKVRFGAMLYISVGEAF